MRVLTLGPCLITGAAGFIGNRLALALRSDGARVRGLVRPEHDVRSLEAAGIEVVRGDATDADVVAAAAAGCRVIFHLAAARGLRKLAYQAYQVLNRQMSAAAARAALAGDGARVVVASTATLTGHHGPAPQTEATPPRPNSADRTSRQSAEHVFEEFGKTEGLDFVIARVPQCVLGPGARDWVRIFRAVRGGRIRVLPRGGTIHYGDVDDVIDGLCLCALTTGIRGERFLLGAERPTPVIALLQAMADELGVEFEPRVVPAAPFRAYVAIGDLAYRVARIELPHHFTSEFYASRFALAIGHARSRLGFSPRFAMRQSVARTVSWLRERGLV